MNKTIKIFGNLIINTLLIISVLALIFLIGSYVQIEFMNKDYPEVFGYTIFQVASGSMMDAIKVDDIWFILPAD